MNITINSYAGAMASFPGRWFTGKGSCNFIAPVGLTISFHSDWFYSLRESEDCCTNVCGCSLSLLIPQSLHIPITDLGPIVNLLLNNPDVMLPEMHWSDLLSPGAYCVWNVPGCPISFGVGGQYAPQYSIDAEKAVTLKNEFRWNIFLAVDIPFLGIYAIK